jgi:type IV secretion system protein VirD4
MQTFYERHRLGSAAWSTAADIHRAKLFGDKGPLLGYFGNWPLRINSDQPQITIGGAGSGKLRDLLAYNLCCTRGGACALPRALVNDPRGELSAISLHSQVYANRPAYSADPFGLNTEYGLPQTRVNPWDLIDPASNTFHADIKLLIADLIPLSGSANAEHWELRAREWAEALVKFYVGQYLEITLPAFYEFVNSTEDPTAWEQIAEAMLNSPFSDVRRVAAEMDNKRINAPKEYSGILGELFKHLNFLSDPAVRECLGASDVCLDILCKQDCIIYVVIPAEYAAILAPMQRAIFSAAALYKNRYPSAPRVNMVVDEAATLGRFEALLRGYSYGRGMGQRWWSCWQDTGQIARNFGRDAISGFLGSSQTRQFFGVRDLETARTISEMLGKQTLEYDSELEQAAARRNKSHIIRELMAGSDPFKSGLDYAQQAKAASNKTKIARALMMPDEVLNMREDQQLLFISGLGIHPILASKYPYFTRREMAGAYMPNPYHPPADKVRIMGRFGMRWAKVIRERVPSKYAHLPQYQSGEWSYIEGYRPS